MAKVACFELPGLTCWFWSNDHNPPHFHVKREDEWEIKVNFTEPEAKMFESLWGDEPSAKLIKQITKLVKANRDELLAEWEAKVDTTS